MAGDWIKVEHVLPEKPEIASMASRLGISRYDVAGRCMRLWIWADQQTLDGNAVSVTQSFLDELVNCDGFADALRQVGWIAGRDGCLEFPNFDRHNGQTAKQRALTKKRLEKYRAGNCNANETLPALPEKRREDTNTPNPRKRVAYSVEFEQFWQAYPNRVGKGAAWKAWKRATDRPNVARLVEVIGIQAQGERWTKEGGRYIPNPATWLNQRRWEDELPEPEPYTVPPPWLAECVVAFRAMGKTDRRTHSQFLAESARKWPKASDSLRENYAACLWRSQNGPENGSGGPGATNGGQGGSVVPETDKMDSRGSKSQKEQR